MIYMICYDIANPKRLRKVAQKLEEFGLRVQKSFFQVEIDKDNLTRLTNSLIKIINKKQDLLFIYPLCDECTRKPIQMGIGEVVKLEAFQIL